MARREFDRNRAEGGRLERVSGSLLVRRFSVRQPEMFRVVEKISDEKLSSIDKAALCELAQTAMDLDYADVEGDFLEAGCGRGGAAVVIARAKRRNRPFFVHDVFREPSDEARVRAELAAHGADERANVQLVAGPYDQTLWADGPLALAHLDVGDYGATRLLLERLAPRLSTGGQIVVDDYRASDDCRRAVDEHFRGKKGFQLVRKGRLHVART